MTSKIICKQVTNPQAQAFSDKVHTDIWGPAPIFTLGGHKYYITFTDDHTHYTWLELLHSKDKALQAYKMFIAWAETQHRVRIKRLRSDCSGEYTGGNFSKFLNSQGIE